MGTTVLVTGVSRYIGARTARQLAARPEISQVIGVDAVAPQFGLGDAEFVRADIRNPILARVMAKAGVDVVVHLSLTTSSGGRSARVSTKEANVMGTMQLLATCQAAPTVRHVILKSTGSVYGASATSPAVFGENAAVNTRAGAGYIRDAVEVESYVRALPRRRPDVGISVLRMAHILGPHVVTVMTEYLRAPIVPYPFGFDARLQFLHEEDAVDSLVRASLSDPVGTINVAGDGIITLAQALRMARRPAVPVVTQTGRLLNTATRWAGVTKLADEHLDYIKYGRCLDTERMKTVLGFEPRHTTRETFEAWVRSTWGIEPRRARPALPAGSGVADAPRGGGPASGTTAEPEQAPPLAPVPPDEAEPTEGRGPEPEDSAGAERRPAPDAPETDPGLSEAPPEEPPARSAPYEGLVEDPREEEPGVAGPDELGDEVLPDPPARTPRTGGPARARAPRRPRAVRATAARRIAS